jgi:hypothetical protein
MQVLFLMLGWSASAKDLNVEPGRLQGSNRNLPLAAVEILLENGYLLNISFAKILLTVTFAAAGYVYAGTGSDALKETASTPGFLPKAGIVPDAQTAIAIAVAVWNPVYGEKEIASEKPYQAVLTNRRWTVTGSVPNGWVGGVATAVIDKRDGRVIKIYHTK